MGRLAKLIPMVTALAACYSTPQPECAFECSGGGSCPDGYTCRADLLCRRADVADSFVCPAIDDPGPDAIPDASPDAPVDAEVDAADATLAIPGGDVDFGLVPIGTAEQTRTVTIENTGGTSTGNLDVQFMADAGSDGSLYIVSGQNGCADRVLTSSGASRTCVITVGFLSQAVQNYGATLMVSATPGGTQSIRVTAMGGDQ